MQFITQCAVDCAYAALTTTVDLDHPELTLNFVLLKCWNFSLTFFIVQQMFYPGIGFASSSAEDSY